MSIDLISITLRLRPVKSLSPAPELPQWWGRAAHSLLLRVVSQAEPRLAEQLHQAPGAAAPLPGEPTAADLDNPQALRPFSVSTLLGYAPRRGLDSTRDYSLRFTSIHPPLSALLAQAVQPGGVLAPGAQVELEYLPFEILEPLPAAWQPPNGRAAPADDEPAETDLEARLPAHHPRSGWHAHTTYHELSAPYLLGRRAVDRQLSLQFASPVSFRSGGRNQPMPLPDLVFGSLLERWNAFAPLAFPPEVRRFAAECLVIQRFELASRGVPGKQGVFRSGAVGYVTYGATTYDRYWLSLLHILADFALYSGVGAALSQGLGQARKLPAAPRRG